LTRRKKSRAAKNNGKQWKKQCAEQWKQSEIRARACVRLRHGKTGKGAAITTIGKRA
jgi:hypothetical protein